MTTPSLFNAKRGHFKKGEFRKMEKLNNKKIVIAGSRKTEEMSLLIEKQGVYLSFVHYKAFYIWMSRQ